MKTVENVAMVLLALVVMASPWALFLAFPVFDLGLIPQVETAAVALHGMAAICTLGLIVIMGAAPGRVTSSTSPAALAIALVGIATALTSVFAIDPAMSWYGALDLGVGALWYFETGVIAVTAGVLMHRGPQWRTALAFSAGLAVAAALILSWLPLGLKDSPSISNWISAAALLAAVPLLTCGRLGVIFALALVIAGIAHSHNLAAWLTLVAFAGLLFATRGKRLSSHFAGVVAIAATIAITALITVLPGPIEKYAAATTQPIPTVASTISLDSAALQDHVLGPFWQRGIGLQVALGGLASRPVFFLTGRGFGAFEYAMAEQGRWMTGRTFQTATATASTTYWDGESGTLHSNNLPIETVLAAGVLGGLSWLGYLYLTVRFLDRGNAIAGALLTAILAVSCALMLIPNWASPLLAIATAAATAPRWRTVLPTKTEQIASLGLIPFALMFTATTAIGAFALQGERQERDFPPLFGVACEGYAAVTLPNAQINRLLYKQLLDRLEGYSGTEREIHAAMSRNNLMNFSCLLRLAAERGDVLALHDSLVGRNRLANLFGHSSPVLIEILGPDLTLWGADLRKLMATSGTYDDLVAAYILHLDAQGDVDRTRRELPELINLLPNTSPARLLAEARLLKLDAAPAAGAKIAAAFEAGLANVIPFSAVAMSQLTRANQ